ncbi:MAG: endonuclease III [Promethearchaeota archaeon]
MPHANNVETRAMQIVQLLKETYPESHVTLKARNPFEVLVATILSAQSTDAQVNRVTQTLFRKYRNAESFATTDLHQLELDIFAVGYYRQKARYIQTTCQMLIQQFDGKVPRTMDELLSLHGVGRKTANIVLTRAFGIVEGIAVDTHVFRISRRLELTAGSTPEKVEQDLMKILPKQLWGIINQLFITFGRHICQARDPQCNICPIVSLCPYGQRQN